MKNIDNIIFDLGGVILTLDYQKTINSFSKLTNNTPEDTAENYSQKKQLPFFDQYERGEINSETFRNEIRKTFSLNARDEAIDDAWNAMLGHVPSHRLEFLKDIGQRKNIFLLSNTNAIHINAFNATVKKDHGIDDFDAFFQKAYYSHVMHMRKPEVRIFNHVVNENNLNKEQTLFIDDSPQHIEGAKKAGLNALLLEKDHEISALLKGI